MEMNYIAILGYALVTLLMGFIWYHPKVFGTIWMRESGIAADEMTKGSMLKIFGLTFLFSLMITMVMMQVTIHQFGAMGMVGGPAEAAHAKPSYAAFMADYNMAFRTFKHGALHGFITGLFLAFPIVSINGMFERKSWKYIMINAGYWMISLMLMGGILCAFL